MIKTPCLEYAFGEYSQDNDSLEVTFDLLSEFKQVDETSFKENNGTGTDLSIDLSETDLTIPEGVEL